MKVTRNLIFVAVLVFVIANQAVLAQSGSITGTIKDQTGAVLPDVSVTVTNIGTNAQRNTLTDARGDYNVTLLPIGTYRIETSMAGFKAGLAENITLNVDDKLRIDFTLQIGEVTENVLVTAAAPLVQSETSSVGQIINNQSILELPLNGRQFESLAQLVPGSVSPAPGSFLSYRGGFNVAGGREQSNNMMLDGVDNNDPCINNFTLRPIVDSIQEFKVLSNSYTAEYGRGGGGQVSVTTKSGTNSFHGAAWEFIRNDVLDAKNFFGSKTPFRRNQYGATLGGPIIRDKTFFFAGYEGLKRRQQFTSLQTVPTVAFTQGDFSAVSAPLKNPFEPGTTFGGNQIPENLIHPVAAKIIDRGSWPLPTSGGSRLNYLAVLPVKEDDHSVSGRIDHQFSSANTMFGRYGYSRQPILYPCSGTGTSCVPGYSTWDTITAQSFSIADTHVFSARLVNELRLGYNRQSQPRRSLPVLNGDDIASELGIPGTNRDPMAWGLPRFSITGGIARIGDYQFNQRVSNTYQVVESVSYGIGPHMIRSGFEWRKIDFNGQNGAPDAFNFDGRWTGNPFADFMLGLPSQTSRMPTSSKVRYVRTYSLSAYIQDDWVVSPRLTLNLGLRYEFNNPTVEKHDEFAQFDIETEQYVIANQNGASRALYRPDKNNFGPRFGFAFRPSASASSVIRGGYGIFYDMPIIGMNLEFTRKAPPFQFSETYDASPTDPNALTMTDPYPASQLSSAVYSVGSVNPGFREAYIQQWNLGYQREFARNMVFEVSYAGSKGTRLYKNIDYNQAVPGLTDLQSRRPYPEYGSMNVLGNLGFSNYHALLTRLQRRFSAGLSFLLSYTYSHSIDNSSRGGSTGYNQDRTDYMAADRGDSDFDARQRLVVSYIFDLPFGHDRRFGSTIPTVLNIILGGWQLSGITTFQSGRPIMVRASGDPARTSTTARPNVTGIEPVIQDRTDKTVYLNPAAFVVPPLGTWGNAPRNYFTGPGTNNFDFTLGKNFRTERYTIQFRTEFFNAFNRVPLDQPGTSVGSSSFGRITSAGDARQIQFGLKVTF